MFQICLKIIKIIVFHTKIMKKACFRCVYHGSRRSLNFVCERLIRKNAPQTRNEARVKCWPRGHPYKAYIEIINNYIVYLKGGSSYIGFELCARIYEVRIR